MKILVIGPSWIGDMVMSHSLYQLLVHQRPDIKIHVMAPDWSRPLLNYMPEVRQSLIMPFKHGELALLHRYYIGLTLRHNNYDQAIVLPNSFKSALIPFFANIPKRTGWRGEIRYNFLNDIRKLDKKAFPLMIHRYIALAFNKKEVNSASDLPTPLPLPHLKVKSTDINATLHAFMLNGVSLFIGFCYGAEFGPAKRWPHYHYATLAEMLIHRGYQIILFGSTKDKPVGNAIYSLIRKNYRCYCHNLTGKTSLMQATALIAACYGIVSNDSGLMHIASALDRSVLALYGPSSSEFTPPLSQYSKVIRLINGYYKIRKGNNKEGYHQSLISIQPAQVMNELENLLNIRQRNHAGFNR